MDKLKTKKYKEAHSLLIYKRGNLILEEYFPGNDDTIDFENNVTRVSIPGPVQWTRTKKHYVASVNKALTSSVVGIALDAKGNTVDDKIAEFLPDYQSYFSDINKAAVDVENCLTMTLGFQWDEWASNDLSLLWKSDNFATFLLSRPNNGPESEWKYCSASPNLLLRCMENLVEGSIREWADKFFYAKLGITDYTWGQQPDGLPEGAARMFIRPRDMLKVGVTYLNNGKWNGNQVIPAKWVEECFKVKQSTSSGDYSYFFWIRTLNGVTFLSADGDGGNYINIIPTLDMVVVITQGNYLEWPLYVNQANDMMKNYIFPAAQ
jgi:CubicO group peptidase (beta-lactamase class C family)